MERQQIQRHGRIGWSAFGKFWLSIKTLGEHLVVGAIALIPNKIAIASLRRNAIALMLDRDAIAL
jgi:hypothetical protein